MISNDRCIVVRNVLRIPSRMFLAMVSSCAAMGCLRAFTLSVLFSLNICCSMAESSVGDVVFSNESVEQT